MRTLSLFLILAALIIALPACDSAADASIGGTYTGSFVDNGGTVGLTIDIPQTESGAFAITSGTATFDDDSFPGVTGSGTYAPPTVSMTFDEIVDGSTTIQLVPLSGTVSDDGDVMTFDLDDDLTLTLRR